MEKITKEIITRESIQKELRLLNRASIRHTLMLLVPYLLIMIPLVLFCAVEAVSSVENLFLKMLFGVVFGLTALLPMLALICMTYTAFTASHLLERGAFDVATYEVSYKSEEYINHRCVERLYFAGLKKPLAVGHTVYQLTSPGDLFYLVTYQTGKPSVKLIYAAKMYEYRG